MIAQRWYFRAEVYEANQAQTVWTGWGTVPEVMRVVAGMVAEGHETRARQPRAAETICKTIRDLLEFWIGQQESRFEAGEIRAATLKSRRGSARHVAMMIGDVLLERVTAQTLESYKDRRLREGAATSSVGVEIEALLMAWGWGAERGLNPDVRLRRPRIKHRPVMDRYTPSPEEFMAVVHHVAEGPSGSWAAAALRLIGYTGARPGEVAALTWGDIDFANLEIRIPASGKTGRRTVAAPKELLDFLRDFRGAEVPEPSARLWSVTRGTFRAWLPKLVADACDAVGCTRWTPKALRRMVADQYRRKGVDLATYTEQMGHSIRIALRDYQQATRADKQRAATALNFEEPRGQVIPFPKRGDG